MERERERQPEPYREPPEAGLGGDGPISDQTVLAPTTDAELAQAVRDALFLDPDVDADNFVVEAQEGVVTLYGRARSAAERRRAIELARGVQRVRRVVDRLAE